MIDPISPSSPTKFAAPSAGSGSAPVPTTGASNIGKVQPPKLSKANLEAISSDLKQLVDQAKELYKSQLQMYASNHPPPAYVSCAPGRVNLIGEHTDYNLGYVLPLCLDKWVVVYGTASLQTGSTGQHAPTTATIRMVSYNTDQVVEERTLTSTDQYEPPEPPTATGPSATEGGEVEPESATPSGSSSSSSSWPNYVVGTVAQYMPDLPTEGCHLDVALSYSSNVPLGAGLSSSAALEVATATILECFFHDRAYSSASPADVPNSNNNSTANLNMSISNLNTDTTEDEQAINTKVIRALRCQKAENEWAHSPCGIMDQLVSSAGQEGCLLLIDCRSMDITPIVMKASPDQPVLLVTNSHVGHEIADSEYGVRRRQCNDALEAMQEVPLYHVLSLRDATLQDVDTAKDKMDETSYRRAKHVVSENSRTMECKTALKLGLWERVGELMNASHQSLRDDYDVSCEEVNFLVDICQNHPGVYGSRMTGGGFGGCIVTLVQKEHVDDLVAKLAGDYKEVLGKECDSFVVTRPSFGAKVLAIDMDYKA